MKKTNLFKQLILSAPINNKLKFGIVENIRITAIDTDVRKKEGLPINQNIFITLSQIDIKSGEIIAQNEGSYWNLDHTSEYVMSNFIDEFTSLLGIIAALGGDIEEFDQEVIGACPIDIDVDTFVTTKAGAKTMQEALINATKLVIVPMIGETSPLLTCKVTVNKKGFFELGKEHTWITAKDSTQKVAAVTFAESKRYRESLKATDEDSTKKPDGVGEKRVSEPNHEGL